VFYLGDIHDSGGGTVQKGFCLDKSTIYQKSLYLKYFSLTLLLLDHVLVTVLALQGRFSYCEAESLE